MVMPSQPLTPEDEELRAKILNEGSIPKRKQHLDNLIDGVSEASYKMGFKEAERLNESRDQQKELELLYSLRNATRERYHNKAMISVQSANDSMTVHTNALIESYIAAREATSNPQKGK
jgi:hypothetical protein